MEIFENYLRSHSDRLDEYRNLKEKLSGKSIREYYRQKVDFINETILLASKRA
jgi:GrpB-like predicted nucleotidyltransferase (UPF0157 family)